MLHTFVALVADKPGVLTRVALFVLLLSAAGSVGAQQVEILIKLVNGKSGRAVTDEKLNVFVTHSGAMGEDHLLSPDKAGYIRLKVDPADAVSVATNLYVDCRNNPAHAKDNPYSVSTILSHGIVPANLCSRQPDPTPVPGQIIIFERSATFLEGMRS